nr:MAG TPA: hypothetical protein [Caudoviricetes sp.]
MVIFLKMTKNDIKCNIGTIMHLTFECCRC